MDSNKLNGYDYVNLPLTELMRHPDFDTDACMIIFAIMNMTSEELKHLNVTSTETKETKVNE